MGNVGFCKLPRVYKVLAVCLYIVGCVDFVHHKQGLVDKGPHNTEVLSSSRDFETLKQQKSPLKRTSFWILTHLSTKKLIRFASLFTGVAHFNKETLEDTASPYAQHFFELFNPGYGGSARKAYQRARECGAGCFYQEHFTSVQSWLYAATLNGTKQNTKKLECRQIALGIQRRHTSLPCRCNCLPINLIPHVTCRKNTRNFCQHTRVFAHDVPFRI